MGENNPNTPPFFPSRLRAKREERIHLTKREQNSQRSADLQCNHKYDSIVANKVEPKSSSLDIKTKKLVQNCSHRVIIEDSVDDIVKRRERAKARKRVIEYQGNIWDAIRRNDLDMVSDYFLVKDTQTLLRRRHPDVEQGGRTLLHFAAWYGYNAIVALILATNCNVDAVDSVTSKTTALMEAARAGHADVCVTLLHNGASLKCRDSHGDTAFHLASRQGHGSVLLQMALKQERLDPGSTSALWIMKNYKNRMVVDLIQSSAHVVPLLEKRLGEPFKRALKKRAVANPNGS